MNEGKKRTEENEWIGEMKMSREKEEHSRIYINGRNEEEEEKKEERKRLHKRRKRREIHEWEK